MGLLVVVAGRALNRLILSRVDQGSQLDGLRLSTTLRPAFPDQAGGEDDQRHRCGQADERQPFRAGWGLFPLLPSCIDPFHGTGGVGVEQPPPGVLLGTALEGQAGGQRQSAELGIERPQFARHEEGFLALFLVARLGRLPGQFLGLAQKVKSLRQRLAAGDRHACGQQSDAQRRDESFLVTAKPPESPAQPEQARPPAHFPAGRRRDGPENENPSGPRLKHGPDGSLSVTDAFRRGRRDRRTVRGRAKGRWRACLRGGDGEGRSCGEQFGESACGGPLRRIAGTDHVGGLQSAGIGKLPHLLQRVRPQPVPPVRSEMPLVCHAEPPIIEVRVAAEGNPRTVEWRVFGSGERPPPVLTAVGLLSNPSA